MFSCASLALGRGRHHLRRVARRPPPARGRSGAGRPACRSPWSARSPASPARAARASRPPPRSAGTTRFTRPQASAVGASIGIAGEQHLEGVLAPDGASERDAGRGAEPAAAPARHGEARRSRTRRPGRRTRRAGSPPRSRRPRPARSRPGARLERQHQLRAHGEQPPHLGERARPPCPRSRAPPRTPALPRRGSRPAPCPSAAPRTACSSSRRCSSERALRRSGRRMRITAKDSSSPTAMCV